jgi:DNA (cytosine-5)-methyltransferase 1
MKVLELFAGYGSQALALENLGIEFTSDISEIDKYAIQAYNQLHGETHNWGDITKIDETKLPYYDLITYSSPCQDFSVAGLGKGGDEGSGTRSSLLWECERIIRAVKPKYLLMENVKNLVGKKHKHNFIRWLRVLEMMGYQNFWKVLNAKDYGVPQNRERVFVVSILGCGQYLFPNPKKLEKRLKDVLETKVDEKYYLSQDKVDKLLMNIPDTSYCIDANYYKGTTLRNYEEKHRRQLVCTPYVCASPGRNPKKPSDRTAGAPTEQRLEINQTGCSNTITTVEKDNYLLEPLHIKEATQKGFADAYKGDSVSLDQPNSKTRRGRVGKQISNTLTTSCNIGVVQVGNIVETDSFGGNPQCGRVYSDDGISPTLNTMQGGGREPKIVCYDIPQTVTVRKHTIDLSKFVETLRTAKEKSGLSNKQISDILDQPLTMVEHWFRTDKCFSVPDKNIWYSLKNLLNLNDEYDAFVTEFEEKEGVFEKANRCYGTDGIAPTMTATSSDEKIFNGYRIRKLTPRECWRLMGVKDEQFDKLHDISNTQLYKLAGNSIVVDVLMGIFRNLLQPDEETKGQLTMF